jgi:hypothetical protein
LDPATDSDVPVPLDLVQARLSYDPVCLNLREIREMDLPLADINIGHPAGLASFTGTIPATGSAPFDLGHALTRLVGSNQQSCPLTMEITSLTDQEGNPISVTGSLTHEFRRGDARADGVINVADALYIAQYLNGLRPACTDVVDTGCLHSVNATSVSQDGPFDRKAIADANFIAQHLLGLRDESYDLLPLPDFDVAEAS